MNRNTTVSGALILAMLAFTVAAHLTEQPLCAVVGTTLAFVGVLLVNRRRYPEPRLLAGIGLAMWGTYLAVSIGIVHPGW